MKAEWKRLPSFARQSETQARLANSREWARSLLDSEISHLLTDSRARLTRTQIKALREDERRRTRKNPSLRSEIAQAKKLGLSFSGHRQNKAVVLRRPSPGRVRVAIGPVSGILYFAKRDGRTEQYLHRFGKKSRPLLATNKDGSRLELLGGAFRFTDRGIEDAPVKVRRPRQKRS